MTLTRRDDMPRISVIGQVLPELKKRKRVAAYARVSMETEMLLHSLSAQVSHYNGLIQKSVNMIIWTQEEKRNFLLKN